MKTLILCLGNELLSDDAAGILAGRRMKDKLDDEIDLVETSASGLALMEFFEGYDRAIIVDSIRSGRHPPGTVMELELEQLAPTLSPSPHYAGLPEIMTIARQLGLDFPGEIRVVAIEISDPYTVGGRLSAAVEKGLGDLEALVNSIVGSWRLAAPVAAH